MRVAVGLLLFGVAACGVPYAVEAEDERATGRAQLALTTAPPDVACVRVIATGATRSVEIRLDVGERESFAADGLPVGDLIFTASAYPERCDRLGTTPTWVATPVKATIQTAKAAEVDLVFVRAR
jgi:hypothetical protein